MKPDDWDIQTDWGGDEEIDHLLLRSRAEKRVLKNTEVHLSKAKALSDLCETPKEGEQYRIITEKQFNAYALILHVIGNDVIEEMHLAIYRINQPTVTSIIDLINSHRIKKATFVISSFFNQTKKPEQWAITLRDFCDENDRCTHIYTHNHAKVLAVKTEKGDHFVFEGSGNMSDNARIEQYLYENNRQSYEFHKGWMKDLITDEKQTHGISA